MRTEKLMGSELLNSGANLRVFVDASDLTEATANTAQTLNLFNVKKGTVVKLIGMRLMVAFQDAADSAFNSTTIKVGDGSSAARYLAATELNVNGSEVEASAGTGTAYAYTEDDTVDAVVSAMAEKSLKSISKGCVMLLFKTFELDEYRG